jgi:peptide/nickel transport system ATP-binding protein
MARCTVDVPPKIAIDDGLPDAETEHWAACWLYDAETVSAEGRSTLPLEVTT